MLSLRTNKMYTLPVRLGLAALSARYIFHSTKPQKTQTHTMKHTQDTQKPEKNTRREKENEPKICQGERPATHPARQQQKTHTVHTTTTSHDIHPRRTTHTQRQGWVHLQVSEAFLLGGEKNPVYLTKARFLRHIRTVDPTRKTIPPMANGRGLSVEFSCQNPSDIWVIPQLTKPHQSQILALRGKNCYTILYPYRT